MPKHHLTLDAETIAVLERSTITADSVTLPTKMLPRPLYEKVNKALNAAGGKWTGKLGKGGHHKFPSDPREVLGLAKSNGTIRNHKTATQAFYTPVGLAARVAMMAAVVDKNVLEPSAGHGALADACRISGAAQITCIESDQKSVSVLESKGHCALATDFLAQPQQPTFDRVVMNPPFEKGQDVKHVTHAFGFLKPGGRLVAIMSPGWQTKQDKLSAAFRDLVDDYNGTVEPIEAGAFKESGTGVSTVLLILNRPA